MRELFFFNDNTYHPYLILYSTTTIWWQRSPWSPTTPPSPRPFWPSQQPSAKPREKLPSFTVWSNTSVSPASLLSNLRADLMKIFQMAGTSSGGEASTSWPPATPSSWPTRGSALRSIKEWTVWSSRTSRSRTPGTTCARWERGRIVRMMRIVIISSSDLGTEWYSLGGAQTGRTR